jgi:hypothetical protein
MLIELPKRPKKQRQDKLLAMLTKSSTEREDPSRAAPYVDMEEPSLANVRRETELESMQ